MGPRLGPDPTKRCLVGGLKIRQTPELRGQPAWTPLQPPSPGIQPPGARGPFEGGGGGPANPEPKTLNHLRGKGLRFGALATLKVVWVPAIPEPSTDFVVK